MRTYETSLPPLIVADAAPSHPSGPLKEPARMEEQLKEHLSHRRALLGAMPDIDDETLADTLEGLTDLTDMIAATLRSALVDEALSKGLKNRISEMKDRQARLEARAQKKRASILQTMVAAEIPKIVDPEFTASVRRSGLQAAIDNEKDIPSEYWIPQPAKLDRQHLARSLKSGLSIPGAHLEEGRLQLGVRTK